MEGDLVVKLLAIHAALQVDQLRHALNLRRFLLFGWPLLFWGTRSKIAVPQGIRIAGAAEPALEFAKLALLGLAWCISVEAGLSTSRR